MHEEGAVLRDGVRVRSVRQYWIQSPKMPISLLRFDARRLDQRPPPLDLGLVVRPQRFGRLLVA